MTGQFSAARDLRVDFFRGIALVCMFWDHIPGNPLGYVTLRNIGLSDAAELFVFLAGYGAMLAYGRAYLRDGYFPASVKVLRRAWVLYVAHVFLLAQLMAVVFVANARVETRDFIGEMGLDYFLNAPQSALVGGVLLQFKPVLMDPLPLYVILMTLMAGLLPLLVRRPWWVLVPSGLLWLLEKQTGLNLPSAPEGVWFFNPLAWQFLFFLGACCARPEPLVRLRAPDRLLLYRLLMPPALLFLLASLLLTLSWHWPALHDALMPAALAQLIYPISKTDLDLLRIAHFLVLAAVTVRLLRPGPWLERRPAALLRLLGRHSLEVFCLSVLLAPLADAAGAIAGDAWPVQVLAGLAGVALMTALAAWLDAVRHPRPVAHPATAGGTPQGTPHAAPVTSR
ncbi:MAG: OpgC domain-containing protein [Gammaproteobacteria bacterium]|nr:OpgC domain-containing protein [Gammaproteobacteria bacterium]MBU0771059.1 OpgC domain-containing protein [Gammaproteobacteria bacterium]MBU0854640.1 OpgC domain-containing protein [Gammaproteobacteria bacterium]MBU1845972.1 OpgC domain-containing protein [Gammaproteobacteria bacterium]